MQVIFWSGLNNIPDAGYQDKKVYFVIKTGIVYIKICLIK